MSYLEELLPAFRKGAKIRSSLWSKKAFIHLKDDRILDETGLPYTIPATAFYIDDWEIYQEPIDWDYIIKNKCLCWFWHKNESNRIATFLRDIVKDENRFVASIGEVGLNYKNCRPVRRDEVTFYEDKKDD